MKTAANDLHRTAEWVYGGLWDALGLRPSRELQQSAVRLAYAQAEELVAQTDHLCVAASACAVGAGRARAAFERLERGRSDLVAHCVPEAQAGRARCRVIELDSESLKLPTRTELDAAFREIQQLKREVRRLKKAAPEAQEENRP